MAFVTINLDCDINNPNDNLIKDFESDFSDFKDGDFLWRQIAILRATKPGVSFKNDLNISQTNSVNEFYLEIEGERYYITAITLTNDDGSPREGKGRFWATTKWHETNQENLVKIPKGDFKIHIGTYSGDLEEFIEIPENYDGKIEVIFKFRFYMIEGSLPSDYVTIKGELEM